MLRIVATLLSLFFALGVHAAGAYEPSGTQTPQQLNQQPATPSTQAEEQVRAISAPTNPLPPEADSAGTTHFSFIVYGDTRGRRDGVQQQYEHSLIIDSRLGTIKRQAAGPSPVRFVLQTGDGVENGGLVRQWNKSFVDLINRLTTEAGIPYFLAPGNHDLSSAYSLDSPVRGASLRNYLAVLANLIPPDGSKRRLDGYPTYSFGYGNSFFIAIDSNIITDDKQLEWVKSQLDGLDRIRYHHVVVFFHHPPFSSGPHGGAVVEPQSATLRAKYLPLFRRHQVRILFSGHEHLFEHWVERYEDSNGHKLRMDQIVTGGGGAPLYAYRGEPDLREYVKTYNAEKVSLEHVVRPGINPGENPYHYVLVHVDGDRIRIEVIGVDWGRGFQPYRSNTADLQDVNR